MANDNNKVLWWMVTVLTGVILAIGGWFFGNIGRSGDIDTLQKTAVENRTKNQIQDVQIEDIKATLVEIKQGVIDINRKIDIQNSRR